MVVAGDNREFFERTLRLKPEHCSWSWAKTDVRWYSFCAFMEIFTANIPLGKPVASSAQKNLWKQGMPHKGIAASTLLKKGLAFCLPHEQTCSNHCTWKRKAMWCSVTFSFLMGRAVYILTPSVSFSSSRWSRSLQMHWDQPGNETSKIQVAEVFRSCMHSHPALQARTSVLIACPWEHVLGRILLCSPSPQETEQELQSVQSSRWQHRWVAHRLVCIQLERRT